ncbi:MAG: hypothetical protein U5K54_07785 [Cytophagales bacterium]|nr:hypothetical protein [Cytophagales bacterium]
MVVGTHGRSIWILDNISPLRNLAKINSQKAFLFPPVATHRVRFNMFMDTPLPPEEPAGQNPPDGAILDYYLAEAKSEVRIEVISKNGDVIYQSSSKDKPEQIDMLQFLPNVLDQTTTRIGQYTGSTSLCLEFTVYITTGVSAAITHRCSS